MFWKWFTRLPVVGATRPLSRPWLRPGALLLSLVVLVACGGAADLTDVTWRTHSDETWGLTFQAPETWSLATEESDMIIVTHPDADVSLQLFLTPTAEFVELGLNEPVAFLQFFSDAFLAQGEDASALSVVTALEETTINGLAAATMTLAGAVEESSGVLHLAALGNETTLVVALGADGAPDNPYGPLLEQMIQSIELAP